jgi:carboxyl-terminal processing protease
MLLLPPPAVMQAPPASPQVQDFDQAFAFLQATYAWGSRVEWELLRTEYRARAAAATTPQAFHRVVEDLLDQLCDAHTHLGSNLPDSWRLPPGGIAAEWRGEDAVVVAVLPGSRAAKAGVKPGQRILLVNGKPLKEALEVRKPQFLKGIEDEDLHWMLNSLLAGRHGEGLTLRVAEGSASPQDLSVPPGEDADPALPEARLLPGDVGYLAFRDFGSEAVVQRLDEAMNRFPQAKAWVLDVRLNYGGDTQFMLPVLGRFYGKRTRYAIMRKREGAGLGSPWDEYIPSRGRTFEGPVAVLVAPWTMSTAEGLAMAVQGTLRGAVFGTRTAGLGAAVKSIQLKHSGLRVQVSAEPVYDLFMRPRGEFRPKGLLDLSRASGEDPILDAALAWVGARLPKR